MVDSEKLSQQMYKTEQLDPIGIRVKEDFVSFIRFTSCIEQPYNQFDLKSRKEYEGILKFLFSKSHDRGYTIKSIEAKGIVQDMEDDFISIVYVPDIRKEGNNKRIEIINISPIDINEENLKEYTNFRNALSIIDLTCEDEEY